jgi:hypothetical protein
VEVLRVPATRQWRTWRLVGAAVDVVLLVLINVWPGWQSWMSLTSAAGTVVPLANAALLVGLAGNLLLAVRETPLRRGVVDAATSTLVLVLLARLFTVFPFAVAPDSAGRVVVRILLGLGMIAAFAGLVTGLGRVARALHTGWSQRTRLR